MVRCISGHKCSVDEKTGISNCFGQLKENSKYIFSEQRRRQAIFAKGKQNIMSFSVFSRPEARVGDT